MGRARRTALNALAPERTSNSPDVQAARERGGRLARVVCPEFERLARGLLHQLLRRRNVNGVERPDVHGERAPGALDDRSVDWREVEHGEQIRQFLALHRRLGVTELAEQAFAVYRAKR